MSEKRVTIGRMLFSVCGVRWDNRCKKNIFLTKIDNENV